jgi:N-acetylglutamate synthase-like GNAT family acetyltransferase
MTNYTIRRCTEKDVGVLVETIRESFRDVAERFGLNEENAPRHPSNCIAEWIQREMRSGVVYFILETGGIVSGCVALEVASSGACYLERLGVLPNQRRYGFGKALVGHVLSEAKLLSALHVDIGIIAEDTELKAWYKRLGFIEAETKEFAHLPFRVTFMSHNLDL